MPDNIGEQLVELGIINAVILEEAIHLPGFIEIQTGQQLSPQALYLLRKAIAKTIVLQRERHAAYLQFGKLLSTQNFNEWVRLFAPFARDIPAALQPIIKVASYNLNWPYTEVWSQSDTSGSRTLKLVKSFTYVYKPWFFLEPHFEKLSSYMDSYKIVLPSRELPSDTFTSSNTIWGGKCVEMIKDEKRLKLLSKASLEMAFIVPLKSGRQQNVTHAIVFYGGPVNRYRSSLSRRFLIPTAQNAVDIHRSVEVIRPDETEPWDTLSGRWAQMCTRHGSLRAAGIADRAPLIQRSRSFTCATNALGEKL